MDTRTVFDARPADAARLLAWPPFPRKSLSISALCDLSDMVVNCVRVGAGGARHFACPWITARPQHTICEAQGGCRRADRRLHIFTSLCRANKKNKEPTIESTRKERKTGRARAKAGGGTREKERKWKMHVTDNFLKVKTSAWKNLRS